MLGLAWGVTQHFFQASSPSTRQQMGRGQAWGMRTQQTHDRTNYAWGYAWRLVSCSTVLCWALDALLLPPQLSSAFTRDRPSPPLPPSFPTLRPPPKNTQDKHIFTK